MPERAPLTPDALLHLLIAAGCNAAGAARYAAPLLDGADAYGVLDTPLRLSHFVAQCAHESVGLSTVHEIWGPTPAQRRYEGRADLGNVKPGDGYRYRGRGLIQLTGRANYRAAGPSLRARGYAAPDFEAEPERAAQVPWCVLLAFDYWDSRHINRTADGGDTREDVAAVTRKVNGGLNGLDDRVRYFARFAAALRRELRLPADAPLDAWPEAAPVERVPPRPPQPLPTPPVPDASDVKGVGKRPEPPLTKEAGGPKG